MNIERKIMEGYSSGNDIFGQINLEKLAIPETVLVTLNGDPIIPASFNIYGHPRFTEEQLDLYEYKKEELKRKNDGEYTPLKLEVSYEERIFDVPRSFFDTIDGIEDSLSNLSDLNEMLDNRRIFHKAFENYPLNEFMIFGMFWLDQFGQVMSIQKSAVGKLKTTADVEDYDDFRANNREGFVLTSGGFSIPSAGSICPCCGKEFTIDDVKNNPCVNIDGKIYHDSCWRNYRKLAEVDKFTSQLMDIIYKSTDYQFELIPNDYWDPVEYSHIPWFLFHTIDGDIKMGWRKRVISIEWQENYKPFDFNELFASEDVTKWKKGRKRGIHAWGRDKAYEYLKKALKAVNPGYSN